MSKWFKTRAKKKTILDDDWDFAKLRVDTVLPVLVGTKVMWAKSFPDVSQKKKKNKRMNQMIATPHDGLAGQLLIKLI